MIAVDRSVVGTDPELESTGLFPEMGTPEIFEASHEFVEPVNLATTHLEPEALGLEPSVEESAVAMPPAELQSPMDLVAIRQS